MIIAIVNNKGGVGKTATAVNLAHALALMGKRVLVVDVDPQCNATGLLRREDGYDGFDYTLYDLLSNAAEVSSCIVPTDHENLFLIPNQPETASLEPELISGAPQSFFRLRNAIRTQALQEFDFTFLDNPPNMGTFVISSLLASDFCIVPTEAGSRYSMDGLVKAVRLIEETRQKLNPDLRFLKLLLTKVDRRTRIGKEVFERIREIFPKEKVFETYVPINVDVQKAEFHGKTVLEFRPNCPAARAFFQVAEELLETVKIFASKE